MYLRYNGAVYSQVMLQSSQSSFLNKFQFLQCCHISDPSKRCQASVAENSIWDFQLLLLYVTDTGHLDSTDRDVKLQLPFELFLADVSCIVRAIIHSYWPYMSRSRVSVINWTGACLKLQPEAGATLLRHSNVARAPACSFKQNPVQFITETPDRCPHGSTPLPVIPRSCICWAVID